VKNIEHTCLLIGRAQARRSGELIEGKSNRPGQGAQARRSGELIEGKSHRPGRGPMREGVVS
jgi:hypothetical protein